MIYIAVNINNHYESIVIARNKELAMAYFSGRDIFPHKVIELSDKIPEEHPSGIIPVLIPVKVTGAELCDFIDRDLSRRSNTFLLVGL